MAQESSLMVFELRLSTLLISLVMWKSQFVDILTFLVTYIKNNLISRDGEPNLGIEPPCTHLHRGDECL